MSKSPVKAALSDHAAAAKHIRAFLKAEGIKGKVKAESSSMTSSVRVSLENGTPAQTKMVTEFANKFQYGHFDGMCDMYEYSNSRDDIPQVKFVFVESDFDDELKQKALDALSKAFRLPAMTYNDSMPYDVVICGEKQNTYSAMRAVLRGSHYPHVPLWEEAA